MVKCTAVAYLWLIRNTTVPSC